MSATLKGKRLSFEFFPPKTALGREKLQQVWRTLNEFKPEFFSVTYGAGGSTRDNTRDIVKQMLSEGIAATPHLSFGGDEEDLVENLLTEYKAAGVKRIVALLCDIPSGMGTGVQMVYANELVQFIREKTGDHFHLEVASYPEVHPQAESASKDVSFLKGKFDAGANSSITQYFYNADCYFNLLEECAKHGIDQPIYPGIMPITNYRNLARFSSNCGAEIPRWVAQKLEDLEADDAALQAFGTDVVATLCEKLLLGGAPGLHFYTMNTVDPTATIVKRLS